VTDKAYEQCAEVVERYPGAGRLELAILCYRLGQGAALQSALAVVSKPVIRPDEQDFRRYSEVVA
jgi:hypothetical protein